MDLVRTIVALILPLALAVPTTGRAAVEFDTTGFVWNNIGEADDVAISSDGAHAYFANGEIGRIVGVFATLSLVAGPLRMSWSPGQRAWCTWMRCSSTMRIPTTSEISSCTS